MCQAKSSGETDFDEITTMVYQILTSSNQDIQLVLKPEDMGDSQLVSDLHFCVYFYSG